MHLNNNHKYCCNICLVLGLGLITLATLLVIHSSRQQPLSEQYLENSDTAVMTNQKLLKEQNLMPPF